MGIEQKWFGDRYSVLQVRSAAEMAREQVYSRCSPFVSLPVWARGVASVYAIPIQVSEYVTGLPQYVPQDDAFAGLDRRARRVLNGLLGEGVATYWQTGIGRTDVPNIAVCRIGIGGTIADHPFDGETCGGTGDTYSAALTAALAETIERHAIGMWSRTSLVRAPYARMSSRTIDPVRYGHLSDQRRRQIPRAWFERDTPLHWLRARNVRDNRRWHVPAQTALVGFDWHTPEESRLLQATTNGVAAGTTFRGAAVSAVCEAVERDAVLVSWLRCIPPRRIPLDTDVPADVSRLHREAQKWGISLNIFRVPTDWPVPVFMGVAYDEWHRSSVAVSTGAGFHVEQALRKVARETLKFCHSGPGDTLQEAYARAVPQADAITSSERRRALWSQPYMLSELDWLFQGQQETVREIRSRCRELPQTLGGQWRLLRRHIREYGHDTFLIDHTDRVARQYGLQVVRALMPNLVPLYLNEQWRPDASPRCANAKARLGESVLNDADAINATPHPFL